jgi:hypothetical protein
MRERTGGIDDENEVAAPAAGGGDAVGGEADGAGLGVRVRGGTREDQRRPRRRRRSHAVSAYYPDSRLDSGWRSRECVAMCTTKQTFLNHVSRVVLNC